MITVTVEKAMPEDAEEFVQVQNKAFYDDYMEFGVCPAYGRTAEGIRQWILVKPNYKIMADQRIIGKISISKKPEGEGHVDCFCIIPEYQNLGIGKQALKLMEEMNPDITSWTLETPLARPRNLHFYERCGYRIVGKMQDEIWLAILKKER